MVQYVSVQNITDLIADVGIEVVLSELADRIESDFKRWDEFEKVPRLASHSEKGVIELMPTSDGQTYGVKYVNGHPDNFELGKQTVTAFGVLADVKTGYPVFLSEMTILTALRTAAMSALVAKYLAPKNARVMAMIGTGCQAEFQALAFKAIVGITDVQIFDIDDHAMDKFEKNMEGKGLRITRAKDAASAVIGADILTTCTADKKRATILSDNMVGRGVHINAIGGDCPGKTELQKEILLKSDIFVEYTEQTRIEGEIQQLPDDYPVTELWEVFTGEKEGRTSQSQITIFDSVGFAVEDFSALCYLKDKVEDTAFHSDLDLLACPEDPKDLFGVLNAL